MPSDDETRPNDGPTDDRPRPRYGEYAPPGWTWQPPQSAEPEPVAAEPVPAARPGAPTADRAWTIALLVLGAVGAVYNVLSLVTLPDVVLESARLSAELLGRDAPSSFTPGATVPAIVVVGGLVQIALWIGAFVWSTRRMRAGRSSWWIPLLAGVVALIAISISGGLIMSSDPTFMQEFIGSP